VTLAWALPLVIVMQARSASVSPRPVAWAAQSPRPPSCLAAPGLWEVSRQAAVERHCRELARAQALLVKAPALSLVLASRLAAEAPELDEARVLRGRASLRVGKPQQALADLLPLLAEGAGATADPSTLLDGGRAAVARADLASAARFYRLLGGRAALLPDRAQQTVAYIEIAAVLLATEAAPPDEVLAYLREARRRSAGSGYTSLSVALSALTWVSQGREAEGQGALSELADPWSLARFESAPSIRLPDGLFHAIMGLALERHNPELSAERYRQLAASGLGAKAVGKISSRRKEAVRRGVR
jgi:hypothetical protein